MSTGTSPSQSCAGSGSVAVSTKGLIATKVADYIELTKPKIAMLALVTVTVGYTVGSAGNWYFAPLLHALFGIALVASGASALNQWVERHTDQRMSRTANRPLPAGRLLPTEVLLFGVGCGSAGVIYLGAAVNFLTAGLALATLLLYAAVYTPLKRYTALCTPIGAIPGALPPVLGWTAAGGSLDFGAFVLFGILFLWQFPHFLAIAWLYRDEYVGAGLRMLPNVRPESRIIGCLAVLYTLALLPVSLLPCQSVLAGKGYFLAAIVLGLGYLICAIRFLCHESRQTARGLLFSSLIYLPLLLLSLMWDHLQLLR